jgi:PfaB family protein
MSFEPIAIIGQSCLLPEASSPDQLWQHVLEGKDLLSDVPDERWGIAPDRVLCSPDKYKDDHCWSKRGGYVRGFGERFAADRFSGLETSLIEALDPLYQWSMECARLALHSAGLEDLAQRAPERAQRSGIILGNLSYPSRSLSELAARIWLDGQPRLFDGKAADMAGIEKPHPLNRFMSGLPALIAARALGLGGPRFCLDAACASSLYAIKLACDRLQSRQADIMLAGGVNAADDLFIHVGFSALSALSRSGQSRPFHAHADGLVPAEGAALVVLERLPDALAAGRPVLGVIRGVGLSNDGGATTLLTPNRAGQARAMQAAFRQAELDPSAVSLLECHATGTPVGDVIEVESTSAVYGARQDKLPVGSLKSNLGHSITVSGAAGLIKVLAAMHAETRPPTLHVETPHPSLFDAPLRLVEKPEPWPKTQTAPRVAAVSSFGFGGNNAHLIVEQWSSKTARKGDTGGAKSVAVAGFESKRTVAICAVQAATQLGIGIEHLRARLLDGGDQPGAEASASSDMVFPETGRARDLAAIELPLTGLRYPPNDLQQTLAQQLVLLALARELVDRRPERRQKNTSVLIGMQCDAEVARYGARWRLPEWVARWQSETGTRIDEAWIAEAREQIGALRRAAGVVGAMPNIPANRLCNLFDLQGPSFTVSCEQASGLVALELAAFSLVQNEIDEAIVGAVDLGDEPVHRAAIAALWPDTAPEDAACMLRLLRLDDARERGEPVLATLTLDDQGRLLMGWQRADGGASPAHTRNRAHSAAGLMDLVESALMLGHRLRPAQDGVLPDIAPADIAQDGHEKAVLSNRLVECSVLDPHLTAGAPDETTLRLRVEAPKRPQPLWQSASTFVFRQTADSRTSLLAALETDDIAPAGDLTGDVRLAITADSHQQLAARKKSLRAALHDHASAAEIDRLPGTSFAEDASQPGELAFVYAAPGASYAAMGRDYALAFCDLIDAAVAQHPVLPLAASWVYGSPPDRAPSPARMLWGCALLSDQHTRIAREVLGLRPNAALGLSAGESNALFFLDAWRDLSQMHADLEREGVFERQIAGEHRLARQAWQAIAGEKSRDWQWASYWLNCDEAQLQAALREQSDGHTPSGLVHITVRNAPGDVIIGGESRACQALVERLGAKNAQKVAYAPLIHCPEIESYLPTWRKIHHRPTTAPADIRFYSAALGTSYEVMADSAADAICGMATRTLDFPRVIERAYQDGVRAFVTLGPGQSLASWIGKTLEDKPHLVSSLDSGQNDPVDYLQKLAARLWTRGFDVCFDELERRFPTKAPLTEQRGTTPMTRKYPLHPAPVNIPPLVKAERTAPLGEAQKMAPAPALPPVVYAPSVGSASVPSFSHSLEGHDHGNTSANAIAAAPAASGGVPGAIVAMQQAAGYAHQSYLEQQARVQQALFAQQQRALTALTGAALTGASSISEPLPVSEPVTVPPDSEPAWHVNAKSQPAVEPGHQPDATVADDVADEHKASEARQPVGPSYDRDQLEVLASSEISKVFGPMFAIQDDYVRQVRLPEPPLLLVDRITGIDAEPGSMTHGTIWTETDIQEDAWYLDDHWMPAGIMVESGQADLVLISWLGADFLNRGERVYRLLGCELSYRGGLPQPGDTLQYEIRVTGHARAGAVRLFFFEYECRVNGELRLIVRNGQAGFFTDDELDHSGGVLWDPKEALAELDAGARVDAPRLSCARQSFSASEVRAFSEGRVYECFGPGFERTLSHTRTPKIQSGQMLLLQQVTELVPNGGPWGRGYLRVENELSPDDWYLAGHFKNDPCMPGTLMCEGCLQAMVFYMAAMGYTLDKDGWRFEPLEDMTYHLRCRGQVTPTSKKLVYEVFVEELWDGPEPTIIADILGTADGLKIFHGRRMALRLRPEWPLSSRPQLLTAGTAAASDAIATVDGFRFDYDSLLACAWGRPSHAFGDLGAIFDGTRHIARLPGPPYHFMSRVTRVSGPDGVAPKMGAMQVGSEIELEYDIDPNAWYFEETEGDALPYCVLLEAVLQPCGWLAVFVGGPAQSENDLYFRNLDGTGTVFREVPRRDCMLRTKTKLTSISRVGEMILVGFELLANLEDKAGGAPEPVYELKTGFGFFSREALAQQVGLPASEKERAFLQQPADELIELDQRPVRYFQSPSLPGPMLLMIDRVALFKDAGPKGLGRLRSEKRVDPAEWFFKAHFYGDPVQPGSLGLEAMIQLLQFHMLHRGMADGIENPRFEPIANGQPMTWKYRGQVTPEAGTIYVEMNIVEVGRDERGTYAKAEAWLWVDKLRIYHARDLGMRVVSGARLTDTSPPAPRPPLATTHTRLVVDPGVDTWLADHRPNYTLATLPLASLADRLAKVAQKQAERWYPSKVGQPEWKVTEIGKLGLVRWIIADRKRELDVALRPLTATADLSAIETLSLDVVVWEDDQTVARCTIELARGYPPAIAAWPPQIDVQPVGSPYESGELFHGPSLRRLRSLKRGESGSSAVLASYNELANGDKQLPFGHFDETLLDAAVHGIPHDELTLWAKEADAECTAYPLRLDRARFFSDAPKAGDLRCETRFAGLSANSHLAHFRIQLIDDQQVFCELELTEALVPMGEQGRNRAARLAFLRDHQFVARVGLSSFEEREGGAIARLSLHEVQRKDWLPGSVASAYGIAPANAPSSTDAAGARELARLVAIKDHVAQLTESHPRFVEILAHAENSATARSAGRPLTRFVVDIESTEDEVIVRGGTPSIDLDPMRAAGAARLALSDWPGEQLFLALCKQFIREVVIEDPAAFQKSVYGRSALYLGNHQIQLESILFTLLATALSQSHVVTIAKAAHRRGWVGQLIGLAYGHPSVANQPATTVYFDQQDRESLFAILDDLKRQVSDSGHSIFLHTQGELGRRANEPVERLSSVFLDLALELSLPIVPVRFAGGLPLEPLSAPLDFPHGYAAQSIVFGRPIEPAELAAIPYAQRRQSVLEALNAVGPRCGEERPSPANQELSDAIASWQERLGSPAGQQEACSERNSESGEARAVILAALERFGDQTGARSAPAISALLGGPKSAPDDWSRALARWLHQGKPT